MDAIIFVKGLIIGFAMAVPIGPVGVLCLRKTLSAGRAHGMVIGLGAATADAMYGSVAAFGLSFISDAIADRQFWISLIGGALLLFLGVRTYRALPKDPNVPIEHSGVWRLYFTSLFLVLTNPVTVFAFLAVFAAVGLGHTVNIVSAAVLVAGVFGGSTLWFFTLSSIATLFREKLDITGFTWVNRIAGALIVLSGIGAIISIV